MEASGLSKEAVIQRLLDVIENDIIPVTMWEIIERTDNGAADLRVVYIKSSWTKYILVNIYTDSGVHIFIYFLVAIVLCDVWRVREIAFPHE